MRTGVQVRTPTTQPRHQQRRLRLFGDRAGPAGALRPHRWGPQRHLGKAESNSSQQPREFQGTRLAPGTPFSPQARFLFKFRDMVKTFRKCAHRYVLERKSCWVLFEEYRSCYIDVVSYPDTNLMNCSLMVTIKLKAV